MTEALMHYGVKGMKWGVRKSEIAQLSDEELQRRVNRLNLEKRYKELMPHPDAVRILQAVGALTSFSSAIVGSAGLSSVMNTDSLSQSEIKRYEKAIQAAGMLGKAISKTKKK